MIPHPAWPVDPGVIIPFLVAVALIAHLKGLAQSPVSIRTSGGPVLKIHFDRREGEAGSSSGGFYNVRLEGEARVVYEGVIAPSGAPVA